MCDLLLTGLPNPAATGAGFMVAIEGVLKQSSSSSNNNNKKSIKQRLQDLSAVKDELSDDECNRKRKEILNMI